MSMGLEKAELPAPRRGKRRSGVRHQTRTGAGFLFRVLMALILLSLAGAIGYAGTFAVGGADGSFETGLGGMATAGDVHLVSSLGILRPTQGRQAVLLTTAPDAGAGLPDAGVSLLRIEQINVPATTDQLRVDYVFLTNELAPSTFNDRFAVSLVLVDPQGEEKLLEVDTFAAPMFAAPWTGYAVQTGVRTLVADLSAHASPNGPVTLELRLTDVGDGRGDSAVLLDKLQLVAAAEPRACANYAYVEIRQGEPLYLDGSCSTDGDDAIVSYRWDFGDGTVRIGRFAEHAYPDEGIYQATLTVTDVAGHSSVATFVAVVGAINHAPQIVSVPVTLAAENTPYRYTVEATDPELTLGDALTYTLTAAPQGMVIDAVTGMITWTPESGSPQQHAVTVQVIDSLGLRDIQSFTVTVGPEVYVIAADDTSRLYVARSNGDGTFADFRFVEETGDHTQGGAAIADFDGDGDFDFISGHAEFPRLYLYYYEKQGRQFAPPVFLGTVGDAANPTGGWLMDMAAEDLNRDGFMDFAVHGHAAPTWLFLHQEQLTFGQASFLTSDFETDTTPWHNAACNTKVARDTTTSATGAASMRIFTQVDQDCLSIAISPADWRLLQGPTLTFAYRIPPDVPAGLLVEVSGYGRLFLGGSPAASPGTYPTVSAVQLLDDDRWHTVTVDLYHTIRAQWPEADLMTALRWWTGNNAAAEAQFWIDDVRVTRRTFLSGFDHRLLPDGGAHGRGMDAADVNGDGHPDIVRGRWSDGLLHLYSGDGTGQFAPSVLADVGTDPFGVVLADFDGDDTIDLIANEGGSGDAYFFKGNGDGTFQPGLYIASLDTNRLSGYAAYDVDHDGHTDLLVVNHAGRQVLFYPGHGDATFGPPVEIGVTQAFSLGIGTPAGRVIGQPFAVVTLDTDTIQAGETIGFDASGSFDDGSIVDYDWHFGDGAMTSGNTVSHRYTAEGRYRVELVLTDDEGKQERRILWVTVQGAAPVADAGGPYVVGEADARAGRWTVFLDGGASHDAETGIARYAWDFDARDGMQVDAEEVAPAHTYTAPGTYTVTLTVYDQVGQSHTVTTLVTVEAGAPPTAVLHGPARVDEGAASLGRWAVAFDASASTDDVGIASYRWAFGDGTTGSGSRPTHLYQEAGTYEVTLTVADHAAQTDSAVLTTTVTANAPPVAEHGGSYLLTEADAYGGKWFFSLDATGSSDDYGIQRYTIDFGDGDRYTTGFNQGRYGTYFAAGTDIYGYTISNARPNRVMATEDQTRVEVIDLTTRQAIATHTLDRFGVWDIVPGAGVAFKVEASKPVMVLENSSLFTGYSAFVPSLDTQPVGYEFLVHRQTPDRLFVYAVEDAVVQFLDTTGAVVTENALQAGAYWEPVTLAQAAYHVFASGKIAMQISGANGYTTIPAHRGEAVGRRFTFATQASLTGAFGVFAYEAAEVNVIDMDSGVSLYGSRTLGPGEVWFQNGVGTRRLRLESTGDVEVWAGDTEGGSGILDLGDDISVTTGRNGMEFYLHTLRDGMVIFAPHHDTVVNIDAGHRVATLGRDAFLRLTPSDFADGLAVHHITASAPVLIQTLGGANGFNDYGTYLGGVSARHRYTRPGVYPLTLTVIDRAGQRHTSSTTVEVQAGAPPVASIQAPAVADETFASGGLWTVPFDASGATDDVGIFSYAWDFGDGATGSGINPSHTYTAPGVYTVTLTVTDHAGQQAATTFTVVVTATDPPVAAGGGPYVAGETQASFGVWSVRFDGSGSADDAGIMSYMWDFGDGLRDRFDDGDAAGWIPVSGLWSVADGALQQTDTRLDRPVVLSEAETARNYTVEVDAEILAGPGQEAILVFRALDPDNRYDFHIRGRGLNDVILERYLNGNPSTLVQARLPFAIVSNVVYRLKAELTDSTIRLYVDGHPVIRTTDEAFLRGRVGCATYQTQARFDNLVVTHTGDGPRPVHRYRQEGTYTVRLTVTDQALQRHTAATTVTIEKGGAPVADAGGPYAVERGWPLRLNSLGAVDDVHLERLHWTFGDGTASVNPGVAHVYDREGTYTAVLTVTDRVGQSDMASATVNVVTGSPPVAEAGGPYQGAVNGPAVVFDASGSHDDYGITTYFWDVDAGVDSDGDGDPANDRDAVGRQAVHTYPAEGHYTAMLTVIDGAGQTATDATTVDIVPHLPPRVITIPWISADPSVPHETFNSQPITLKGVVHDADPVTYVWEFGDGTTSGPLPVLPGGHHRLEARHLYPDVPAGTPFLATLTVTDSQGNTGSAAYPIRVQAPSLDTRVHVAIDEALWYAHKQQDRSTGQWHLRDEVATTASMLQAFQANAHLPGGDPGQDPYVTTVRLGLSYVLNRLTPESIAPQPAGDPDSNGNGIGIRVDEASYPYQGGMVMDALIASGAPAWVAHEGPEQVKGRRYIDIVQDMVDAYAYGQYDDGIGRGGWRYHWNQFPDNSASQWGAIGLIPAEGHFGNRVPPFVKSENLLWLDFSQDAGSGHFGYSDTRGVWGTVSTTASGMVQLVMDGVTRSEPRWTQAEHYLRRLWETPSGNDALLDNFYAMFALAKAMRLARPGAITHLCDVGCAAESLDWYGDPVLGLAANLVARQDPDGGWTQPPGLTGSIFWERNLVSAWAILMLSNTLFEVAPVADAGPDRVWGVDVPLGFDGSASLHADPSRRIVLYEWDFDGDGVFDASHDGPTASFVYTTVAYPAATLPRDIIVTLRVTGDRGQQDTDTAVITLAVPPHPPVADAGGPYLCSAGVPCVLDGSGSFDIDPTDGIAVYAWELDGSGIPDFDEAFGSTVSYVFPTVGTFNLGLRVTDHGVLNDLNGNGQVDVAERLRDQDFTTVRVRANQPPVADAGGPYVGLEGTPITLDATATSDPDGHALTYLWDFDRDGLFDDAAGPTPSVVLPAGVFNLLLQVSDGADVSTHTTVITVYNVAPTADAGVGQTVDEGQQVTLDGSGSHDPGTADLAFHWQQSSGTPVVLELTDPIRPTFTAPTVSAGGEVLVFTLTVHDGELASMPVAVEIAVRKVNAPPVCEGAQATPNRLWPPNHAMVPVVIGNITDPDQDAVVVTVTAVTQDEPVNGAGDGSASPDAVIMGSEASVRRERSGAGNGRVYHIAFEAGDGFNEPCVGVVQVCVPHSKKALCLDDGQQYDALQP